MSIAPQPEGSGNPPRRAISKRLRYEILRRDNHACIYCGATAPDAKLVVDHVTPVTLGGTNDPTNLVAACSDCNAGKSSTNPDAPLVADVSQTALRWRQAVDLAAALAARDFSTVAPQADEVIAHWLKRWKETLFEGANLDLFMPPIDARSTMVDFICRGLDARIAADMVDVTIAKYVRDKHFPNHATWSYFMGCCRKKLAEIETSARHLMEQGDV